MVCSRSIKTKVNAAAAHSLVIPLNVQKPMRMSKADDESSSASDEQTLTTQCQYNAQAIMGLLERL